jgi:hypothetical protein
MFSSTIIRVVAVLIAVTSAVAHGGPDAGPAAPRPSNTSCTFSCPKQDVGRYNSHAPSCGNEDQGLVCSFPSKDPGAHGFNRQFTCTYNPVCLWPLYFLVMIQILTNMSSRPVSSSRTGIRATARRPPSRSAVQGATRLPLSTMSPPSPSLKT